MQPISTDLDRRSNRRHRHRTGKLALTNARLMPLTDRSDRARWSSRRADGDRVDWELHRAPVYIIGEGGPDGAPGQTLPAPRAAAARMSEQIL
jgi:hypothetical protein